MGSFGRKAKTLVPDTLLGSVAVLLAVNLVQRSIGFGRGVLFCRWLEPEELGQWEMAYGFLLLAAPVAVLALPGCFGRYLGRFRQQGQLRTFLTRTATWTLSLAAFAVVMLTLLRSQFAWLVFGQPDRQLLVLALAGTLALVISHHFLENVFAGLRLFRVVSAMHFTQSLGFAVIAISLLQFWRPAALSIVSAYGLACLISITGVLLWSRRLQASDIDEQAPVSHREFWPPLLQFAVWVWITSLLSNLFTTVDRYMILHLSGMSASDSIQLIGNYHASMIIPVLMISIANLIVGAMTPHLSHDWENGNRESISFQLNLGLKGMSVVMTIAGFAVLAVAPLLFEYAFAGKYSGGLRVMHWTVASCVWFSILLMAQVYLWITEKTRLAAIPLVLGLTGNVVLNLLLLPRLGLLGAVMATALATFTALLIQLCVNLRLGMSINPGTFVLVSLPLLLTLPTMYALAAAVLVAVLLAGPGLTIEREEWFAVRATLYERVIARLSAQRGAATNG